MKITARIAAIGITEKTVRIASVKTGGTLPKVLETVSVDVAHVEGEDGDEALVVAVRQAIAALTAQPAAFVLCAPADWAIVRLLTLPFKGRRRVGAAVSFELEPHLAVPIEELVVDYVPVREVGGKTEVLVVGIRRDRIQRYAAVLEEAGCGLDGVGLDVAGAAGAWIDARKPSAETRVLLHFGQSGVYFTVVRNRRLGYMRRLSVDLEDFDTNTGAAVREVQNAVRAYLAECHDDSAVESLTLVGCEGEPAWRADLEQALDLPVRADDLFDELTENVSETDARTTWAGLIAVAGSGGGGAVSLDFLPEESGSNQARRGLMRHALACGLLVVGAFAAYLILCYVDYRKNLDRIDALGQAVWDEFAATFPGAKSAQTRPSGDIGGFKSLDLFQKAIETESQARAVMTPEMFNRPTILAVLREITEFMPANVVQVTDLKVVALKKGASGKSMEITITGTVKNSAKFNVVLERLELSDIITIDRDKLRRSSAGGRETFVITATD